MLIWLSSSLCCSFDAGRRRVAVASVVVVVWLYVHVERPAFLLHFGFPQVFLSLVYSQSLSVPQHFEF